MFFRWEVNYMAVDDFYVSLRNRPQAFLWFAKSSQFFLVIKICLEKQTKKVTRRNLRNKKPVWKLSHVQLHCEWKDCSTLLKWVVLSGVWAFFLKFKYAGRSILASKQFSWYSLRSFFVKKSNNFKRSPSNLCLFCWAASSTSVSLCSAAPPCEQPPAVPAKLSCYWLKAQFAVFKQEWRSLGITLCLCVSGRMLCCNVECSPAPLYQLWTCLCE